MKKLTLAVLGLAMVLIFASCRSTLTSNDPAYPSVSTLSDHVFVYDITNNRQIQYSKDGSDKVYPASITKLLTALYALEIMPDDTLITPGDEVYMPQSGSSSAHIRPNHVLTLEMLIEGMMLPSGNDAAYAVAAAGGRALAENDSLETETALQIFMNGMNQYAEDIGCKNTHFTAPDGYTGEEHYSTTGDIALIAKAAVGNEIIMKYAGMQSDSVIYESGHTNTWTSTNKFLDHNSKYYNEYVTGLKTGSLSGNYCMITTYNDGTAELIIGVFGCPTDDGRYDDTIRLINSFTVK